MSGWRLAVVPLLFIGLCMAIGLVLRDTRGDVPEDAVRIRLIGPGVYRAEPAQVHSRSRPGMAAAVRQTYEEFVAKPGCRPYVLREGDDFIEFTLPSDRQWKEWEKRRKE
jgi:hypothetical protein